MKVIGDLLSILVLFRTEFQHRVVLQKIQWIVMIVGRGAKVAIEKFSDAFNVECGGDCPLRLQVSTKLPTTRDGKMLALIDS